MLKQMDWKLVGIVLAIFAYGLVILSSATHVNANGDFTQMTKQILAFCMGIAAICFILMIDYNFVGRYYKELYIISIFLLAVVMLPGIGVTHAGARSWLNLGPLDLQTSEIVKITFILSYAKIVESKRDRLRKIKDIIPLGLYAIPFIGLLLAQPDLGTAIVFMCIIAAMLFTAGLDSTLIKRACIIVVVLLPIIYLLMAPHQKVRIDAFLHPEDVSLPGNYQVMQSLIAIGSGGITGKGLYQGSQNQEDFLPVQDSDFIFAVVGEELGAIGMAVMIGLFVAFIFRLLYAAQHAKDFYGTLIVVGVLGMFGYQIIQNIGMTVTLIPVTGVTLPFVSYGGSSLLTSMANLGLVLNVYMRRNKINFR
ncbi:rod shape-determining protein RodA [Peptacetobacter hominis]|uniref:Rod shape-determining protein RodA n=1 Tax=Peptacetobacter hominis TaxID=2743610 RepID=A0A544QTW7_9FIRM|nr:rod shape-determining protein RodA [Peptacetobacter hominis]TQQ84130.1 rod shape-determining protein RodA [Peptacetobacter hominis]